MRYFLFLVFVSSGLSLIYFSESLVQKVGFSKGPLKEELLQETASVQKEKQPDPIEVTETTETLPLKEEPKPSVEAVVEKPEPTPMETPAIAKREKIETPETLTRSAIQSVVKKQMPFFRRCFIKLLAQKPESKGRVVLNFTIQPSGKVTDILIQDATLKEKRFHGCLETTLERARFQAFENAPIIARYPLKFE